MKTKKMKDELIGRSIKSPVYSEDGHLLLNEGTIVNYNILSKLERHQINTIDLLNSLSKDIASPGVIDDRQTEECLSVVKKVFDNVLHNDIYGVSSAIPPEHLDLVKEVVDSLVDFLSNTENLLYTVSDMLDNASYTYKHSINVSILSILTSKALKYSNSDIKNIALGAFLHDIGKLIVDQSLITKPESLTSTERKEVQKHSIHGYELIKDINNLPFTAKQIVLLHHEKLDGSGYPFGLKGIEIPEFVRIVTLCDMYDAMTTDRVYRGKMPIYKVLEILMTDSVFKLDRKIYRHMTEIICLHPPGSGVVLSDGRFGIVSFYRPSNPSRPHIRVIDLSTDLTDIKVETVNLEKIQTLFIVDTWDVYELRKGFKPTFKPKNSLTEKVTITKDKLTMAT